MNPLGDLAGVRRKEARLTVVDTAWQNNVFERDPVIREPYPPFAQTQ